MKKTFLGMKLGDSEINYLQSTQSKIILVGNSKEA